MCAECASESRSEAAETGENAGEGVVVGSAA